MRRREFIALIATAALSFPRPGRAETKTDLPLVAVLHPGRAEMAKERIPALRLGLQEAGLIEGIHYTLAIRIADGDLRRVPSMPKN